MGMLGSDFDPSRFGEKHSNARPRAHRWKVSKLPDGRTFKRCTICGLAGTLSVLAKAKALGVTCN